MRFVRFSGLVPGHALCIVCAVIFSFVADEASAQASTHVYGVVGSGPAELSGGVDWLPAGGPVGIWGEAGILAVSVGPSYHFGHGHPSQRLDIFATAGYLAFTDLNYEDVGVSLGGGVVYWMHRHFGFRLSAYGFVPVKDEIRTPHHHWGIQGGIAFSFHPVGAKNAPDPDTTPVW